MASVVVETMEATVNLREGSLLLAFWSSEM